ncbi:MAG TPA: ABC transporter permease [Spirochaetota bacterium]
MNLKGSFRSAIKALLRNKMRSTLTSIGIVIGVSSVIMMVGLGSSAKMTVRDKIANFGANGFSISLKDRNFLEKEYLSIKKLFPQIKYISPILRYKHVPIRYAGNDSNTYLFCVTNDYFLMRDWKTQSGRYFFDSEITSNDGVAIIGSTVAQRFFGYYNAVGKVLIINERPYKIVGVLEESGSSLSGVDFDDTVLIPYTTGMIRFEGDRVIDEIYASAFSESDLDSLIVSMKVYLRTMHNIPAGVADDFTITTSKDKLKMADSISQILTYLLAGVASISLIVGGVGIMNIMLVSVSERTREIGIRMAIGAKKRDILVQFIIESVTLSTLGGCLGITLGLVGYFVTVTVIGWPFLLSAFSIFISFLFSSAVGIFFGFYPARKASDLKPIDALRYE